MKYNPMRSDELRGLVIKEALILRSGLAAEVVLDADYG
jgi:hypothetical protein